MNPCRSDCPQGDCANCVGFDDLPRARFAALPACMGGWCSVRSSCALHHAADRRNPAERLCSPGLRDAWQPVAMTTAPQPEPEAA